MRQFAWLAGALYLLTAAQPAPASGLTPKDQAILSALAETLGQSSYNAEAVWPGFNPAATPMVLYDKGRLALLVNHPKPPLGFSPLTLLPPTLRGHVHAYWGEVPQFNRMSNVSASFGSVRATFLPYQHFRSGKPKAQDLLTPLFAAFSQERFRALSELSNQAPESSQPSYIETPTMLALVNLENRILAHALRLKTPDELRGVSRYFMAVRKERGSNLPPKTLRFEGHGESVSGAMRYTITRYSLDKARKGVTPPASEAVIQDVRRTLIRPITDEDSHRAQLSASGAAMGLLLERLGTPHWKEAVMRGKPLAEIFSEAIHYRAPEGATLLHTAKTRFGYAQLLAQANDATRQYPAVYKDFLRNPGARLALMGLPRIESGTESPAPRDEEWLRIIGPSTPLEIDEQTLFISKLEAFDYRSHATALLLKNTQLAMKSNDATWPFENLFSYPSDTTLSIELNDKPFSLQDGVFPFQHLRIEGSDLAFETSSGTLQVKGQDLTILLSPN